MRSDNPYRIFSTPLDFRHSEIREIVDKKRRLKEDYQKMSELVQIDSLIQILTEKFGDLFDQEFFVRIMRYFRMLELPKGSRHELPSENIYIVLHGTLIVSSISSKQVRKNEFRKMASIASSNNTNPFKSLILADDSMRRGGPVDGNGEKVGKKFGKEITFADHQSKLSILEVENGFGGMEDGSIMSAMGRIRKTASFIGKIGKNSFLSKKIGIGRVGGLDLAQKVAGGTPRGSVESLRGSFNGDGSPKGREEKIKKSANVVRFDSLGNLDADASILEYYIDENCNNQPLPG